MYKLINDETITEQIKKAFKQGITRGYLNVLESEQGAGDGFVINEENYLQSIDFDDERYFDSEGLIGTVIAKSLNGKFINIDSDFNIENREVECYIGAEVGNTVKYLKLGTFIVQKPDNDNVNDSTTFEALDYMVKFNKKFEDRLNYNDSENPVTILDLLEDVCDQVEVTCGTEEFRNSDFVLENNQFVNGETCRDVLKAIAQMAFSWARINEDNELVLDFDIIEPEYELTEDVTINNEKTYYTRSGEAGSYVYTPVENPNVIYISTYYELSNMDEINYDEYIDLKINNEYGPLNTIILRNSQVEGENYSLIDPNMQPGDEVCELVISDNPFAYTQEKRQQLIQAGAEIFGFRYVPIEIKTIGAIYLNCLDKIRIKNTQDEYLDTYIFNNKITYDGTVHDEKQTKALTKTETKYKFIGDVSEKIYKTELMVDKANQLIQSLISTTTSLNEGISLLSADMQSKLEELGQDLTDYQAIVSTQFAQTNTSFEYQFNQLITRIANDESANNEEFANISKYIRFENGNIILGESNNPLILTIQNDRISYTQNGTEVAYFSDNKLYVKTLEVLESLRLGNFAFTPRANGSLTFGKVV